MTRIDIITDIAPDALNRGGPSGLIYEVMQALRDMPGVDLRHTHKGLPGTLIRRRLAQLLLLRESRVKARPDADVILVYPSTALRHVVLEDRKRTIVLGPDSQGLLYRRGMGASKGWRRLRAWVLTRWFTSVETRIARDCAAFLVVGRTDVRWTRRAVRASMPSVRYLPHPLLSQVLLPIDRVGISDREADAHPVLLFSGASNDMYSSGFLEELIVRIAARPDRFANVLFHFVGEGYACIRKRLQDVGLETRLDRWVEQYESLFESRRVAQIVCLRVGAGTKNRVLTALANGAYVFGTPVAIENCGQVGVCGRFAMCASPEDMLAKIDMWRFRAHDDYRNTIRQIQEYRDARGIAFRNALVRLPSLEPFSS